VRCLSEGGLVDWVVREVGVLTLEEPAEGEEEGGHFCV
jgi:hypothetical protein